MSSIGGSLSEYLDPSRFPYPEGGCSTSTSFVWRPFKVSLISSREHKMRVNSGERDGLFVGRPCNESP